MTTLEEKFDKYQYIISILNEIRDKIDLQQRASAMILKRETERNDLLKEQNRLLSEQKIIKRNTGWDS